jgi:ABC-type transport system involved in cytochrome c biogenesis permease component
VESLTRFTTWPLLVLRGGLEAAVEVLVHLLAGELLVGVEVEDRVDLPVAVPVLLLAASCRPGR